MRSVSLENGAEYGKRHLHANFNRVKFIAQMKKTWGRVKFRQIILDCECRRMHVSSAWLSFHLRLSFTFGSHLNHSSFVLAIFSSGRRQISGFLVERG